jgi:hypothetical protein
MNIVKLGREHSLWSFGGTPRNRWLRIRGPLVSIVLSLRRFMRVFVYLMIGLGARLCAWGLDLTEAVVVAEEDSPRIQKAAVMLKEEVEKRTGVRWQITKEKPAKGRTIVLLREKEGAGAEGYTLRANEDGVWVDGNDERGVMFGAGRLLREMRMTRGKVTIEDGISITTAPKYALRGHQLGYRPKTHAYDAWDVKTWEQYYRDLIVFGANAVELIPPRSDDDKDSPHFPLPPMEMMIAMSKLADDYGLDVWIWYPAMDKDYSEAKTVEFALKEWAEVFSKLPRIDVVFVPGGDPGHTQPKHLMALLEKQTASLRKYHPKAQMWVSPQSFNKQWLDEFLEIVKGEPAWLGGIVFGPQVRISLPELRKAIPESIRFGIIPTSRTRGNASIRCRIGMWRLRSRKGASASIHVRWMKRRFLNCCSRIRLDF